jgi:CCR4-NOT transcription complex subunit 1
MRLLDDIQGSKKVTRRTEDSDNTTETQEMHAKLLTWFRHWIYMFRESASTEKAFLSFIPQFTSEGYLAEDALTKLFFRVCTEASVASYHQRIASGDESRAFQDIDAFSRLIVMLIKYNGDVGTAANADMKKRYLSKILSIVVLVLVHQHEELGMDFQQKPFFRFFSSLLHDLHSIESSLQTTYVSLLLTIWYDFHSIYP